jgi:hypothetical protein
LVRGSRTGLASLLFRTLECALSLTGEGGDLRILAAREAGRAGISFSWKPGAPPTHSPFSRPELGLLIAHANWERLGARCTLERKLDTQTCMVQLPLLEEQFGPYEADRAVQPIEKSGGYQ